MQMTRLISSCRNVKALSRISFHQTRLFRHQPEDLARPIGRAERNVIEPAKGGPIPEVPIVKQPLYTSGHIKQLVKQYGPVAFTCFIAVSLTNLGLCYLAVKFGLVNHLIQNQTIADLMSKYPGASAGTEFILAYAIHKFLAPLRYLVTATLTPVVVAFLRNRGWMKKLTHSDFQSKK